jgi:MobA/VirD2-like, nuclease domain
MILKGNTRTGAADLVNHLMNERDNDHVEVHALAGFASTTFADSLFEVEAIAKGTNCKKPFFSLSLNPPMYATVTERDFEDAIEQAGKALGLADQPRAVIFHEKEGRRHCHVIWSRIDAEHMKVISDSYTRYKLQEVSRALFLQHGWELPKGLNRGERGNKDNTSRADQEVAKRSGLSIEDHKTLIRKAWAQSDSAQSFVNALETHGYILCQGKRGFVAIDIMTGDAHSIPRQLGMKKQEIESRIGPPAGLPSVDTARKRAEERRKAMRDTENPKESREDAYQRKLSALKKQQRSERQELIKRQTAERDAQEHSFALRLRTRLKTYWELSKTHISRLRDQWRGKDNNTKHQRRIVELRKTQEQRFSDERDVIRQRHLKMRHELQRGLKAERHVNRQEILAERSPDLSHHKIAAKQAKIKAKLERDRKNSRKFER